MIYTDSESVKKLQSFKVYGIQIGPLDGALEPYVGSRMRNESLLMNHWSDDFFIYKSEIFIEFPVEWCVWLIDYESYVSHKAIFRKMNFS